MYKEEKADAINWKVVTLISVPNQRLEWRVRTGPCLLSTGNGDQLKITRIHNEQILPDHSFLLSAAVMLDSIAAWLRNSVL